MKWGEHHLSRQRIATQFSLYLKGESCTLIFSPKIPAAVTKTLDVCQKTTGVSVFGTKLISVTYVTSQQVDFHQ